MKHIRMPGKNLIKDMDSHLLSRGPSEINLPARPNFNQRMRKDFRRLLECLPGGHPSHVRPPNIK